MASSSADIDSQGRYVPIRREVITICEEHVARATSQLFRPFQERVHQSYAEAFVAELTRRLDMKLISQRRREECLVGIVWYLVEDTKVYRASTNLFAEFELMFDVMKVHLGKVTDSETESEDSNEDFRQEG